MARWFRFVEKKRGARRTGSNLVGSVGEAVFCGLLFFLGTLSLSVFLTRYLLDPDPQSFALGVGSWLLLLVMGSFVLIGGAGLVWTALRVGTSAERRGAMARQATDIDLVHEAVPRPRSYPTLPPWDGLTNSPGTELAYRLPPSSSPGWRLLATAIFVVLWNGVGCLLTVWAIGGHIAGRPEWLLTVLLVPYWAVSAWSIRYLLELLLLHTGMGMTILEIADLPVLPGHEYQVAISQHGHITIKSLQLWLVCEEEATYQQGTDIRSETREVFRLQCYERRSFRIEPTGPFHDVASVTVPETAMHSFISQHHAIRWKLMVRGEAQGWPVFERCFPLVVFPGEVTSQAELPRPPRSSKGTKPLPAPVTAEVASPAISPPGIAEARA